MGGLEIDKITAINIQTFINQYSDRPNIQKKIYDVINSALNTAVQNGKIKSNPAEYVKRVYYKKQSYRALEFNEQKAIYDNAKDIYRKLFFVACCTGIRIGKLLELDNKSIDRDRGIITIVKKQKRGQNETYKVPFIKGLFDGLANNGKVFKGVTYNAARQYFDKLFKSLNIERANLHCFRHTFGSVCYHVGG